MCDFCKNDDNIKEIEMVIGKISYCPICGMDLNTISFFNWLNETASRIIERYNKTYDHDLDDKLERRSDKEIVELDGQRLVVDRPPCKIDVNKKVKDYRKDLKPFFDWENVNIDRELELLNNHDKERK